MVRISRSVYVGTGLAAALAVAGWGIHAVSAPHTVVRNASVTLSPPTATASVVDPQQGAGGGNGYGDTDVSASASPPTSDAHPTTGGAVRPPVGAGDLTTSLVSRTIPNLGAVVTDSKGFLLYRFDKDRNSPPTSNCAASCASSWLPVVTADAIPTLQGIDRNLVGTVRRVDGSMQLTIAGWPVYRYSGDPKAGAWKGQGAAGAWWVITPSGKKNPGPVPTATTTTTPPPPGDGDGGGNGVTDPKHW